MNSTYLTKLYGRQHFLNRLEQINLVSPSIGRPFPTYPVTDEKLIIHNALIEVQRRRRRGIAKEIAYLMSQQKYRHIPRRYEAEKKRYNEKLEHLKRKFKPFITNNIQQPMTDSKERNRKSRERYKTRKLNQRIKQMNEESMNVINLSSQTMTKLQKYVLELGHGFIPTPNNGQKEEEILILEGLRVTDRINKLDKAITEMNQRLTTGDNSEQNDIEEMQSLFNDSVETFDGFPPEEETFVRQKELPKFLKFSQPKEGQLNNPITKKTQ